MSIDCLFDTNSIIKYYHNETGSDTVQYILDKSPNATINILNTHAAEVISTFYKLRKQGHLRTDEDRDKLVATFLKDIQTNKILLYDFRTEHIKDVEAVFDKSFSIPPPVKTKISWIQFKGGVSRELKDIVDTLDVLLLVAMREIQYLVGESYLFTSDGHMLDVSRALHLAVINPEKTTLDQLPSALDRRKKRFKNPSTKIICSDSTTGANLGTAKTIDISETGVCLANINVGDRKILNLKISSFNDKKSGQEVAGHIIWTSGNKIGIKLATPVTLS